MKSKKLLLAKGGNHTIKSEKLLLAIGNIDDDLISGAFNNTKSKKMNVRLKWGAVAACLCMVIAGAAIRNNRPDFGGNTAEPGEEAGGGGIAPGGVWPEGVLPEGIDPVVASVAIFPAGENLSDVADATLASINEKDAKNIERLGTYLPDTLPEGCRYGTAGYYETTMRDGTRYQMIRVTYESGQGTVPAPVTENAQAASEMTGNTAFLWMVWGHRPDTNRPVYQPDEVTIRLLEQTEGVFYIDYDGVYVGIERIEIDTKELLNIIRSIE